MKITFFMIIMLEKRFLVRIVEKKTTAVAENLP